jgi:uncharacterized protein
MGAARASFLALLLCWAVAAFADVAVPPLTGRVVDQTGTLSSEDIASLTQKLRDFEAKKGTQIAVLIVPTTAPESIEQYSIRVADAWKVGRKKVDDGAILLVAKNDRKLRIEVGYGLEGALTDATARRIIDEIITPEFRGGDFAGGISAGVDQMIRVADGEPLPPPEPHGSFAGGEGRFDILFNPLILFGVFVAGAVLRSLFGRLVGSVALGGLVGVVAWIAIGSLVFSLFAAVVACAFAMFAETAAPSNGRRGGWYGGPYGGSYGGGYSGGGGGSSDSGGFSGGGGSFGGGGASGSW